MLFLIVVVSCVIWLKNPRATTPTEEETGFVDLWTSDRLAGRWKVEGVRVKVVVVTRYVAGLSVGWT